jgi:hypothetical protein
VRSHFAVRVAALVVEAWWRSAVRPPISVTKQVHVLGVAEWAQRPRVSPRRIARSGNADEVVQHVIEGADLDRLCDAARDPARPP